MNYIKIDFTVPVTREPIYKIVYVQDGKTMYTKLVELSQDELVKAGYELSNDF